MHTVYKHPYRHSQVFGNSFVLISSLLILLSFTACDKDNELEEEELPALGTCAAVTPVGGLSYSATDGLYIFRTNGGGKIQIDPDLQIIFSHEAYPGFKYELWGSVNMPGGGVRNAGNHENLNGKHLKDRLGSRRTIIFPDGAKLTLVSTGVYEPILSISIYDGAQSHHINLNCNKLEHSSTSTALALQLDEAEADGETAVIEFTNAVGGGGAVYVPLGLKVFNVYTEDTPGNKKADRYLLGEIERDNPTRVNDYYDDPRLGHT